MSWKRGLSTSAVAVALLAASTSLSGCVSASDDDLPTGGIAIRRTVAGHPAVTLKTCSGSFDHIEILQMHGDGASTTIGSFRTSEPVSGEATIDLMAPAQGWTATVPLREVEGLIVANAWGSDKDSGGSNQATFTFAAVAALEDQMVISDLGDVVDTSDAGGPSRPMALSAFVQDLCSTWNE